MDVSGKDAAIGFFTTDFSAAVGLTGGYLLLNLSGRPLEFHCTLPVRPSRAHEILYGEKLRPHLIGERIGPALLERTRIKPLLICIDDLDAEILCTRVSSPMVLLQPEDLGEQSAQSSKVHASAERLRPLANDASGAEAVREALSRLNEPLDLAEPFQRIREALREAHQSATRAA